MTVPLTKVSNHILVLQTQIVLDRQTDRRFLREKPMFLSAKGTTKKADAFDFFVYPNLLPSGDLPPKSSGFYELNLSRIRPAQSWFHGF